MKKKGIFLLKSGVVFAGAGVVWLCFFWLLPLSFEMAQANPEFAHLQYPLLLGLYLTTIPFLRGVAHAYRYLKAKENRAPVQTVCLSLKIIQKSAVQIILLYILGMLFLIWQQALHPGVWLLGMGIIFTSSLIFYGARVLR